jgi:hypothetical protein
MDRALSMKDLIEKKAKERAPRPFRTEVVGWTEEELDQLDERFAKLEPALLQLQRQEGIRIRSAGTTATRATVGIGTPGSPDANRRKVAGIGRPAAVGKISAAQFRQSGEAAARLAATPWLESL